MGNKFLKNFLALLIGISVAFVTLEVGLRIFHPFELRVKGNKIVLPTNKKYVYRNNEIGTLDKTIIHTKNSLGFRGVEPPINMGQYLTIITVGGSTTECVLLSDGETWSDVLAVKLSNDFTKVWVNNAGLDGHSTFGHIVLLEDYVIKLNPKVALFLVGANDMHNGTINKFDVLKMQTIVTASLRDLLLSLRNVSEVFNSAHQIYSSFNRKTRDLVHKRVDLLNIDVNHVPQSTAEELKSSVKEKLLDEYRERVIKLIEVCRTNSIEPVLITQPALYGNAVDTVTGVDLGKIRVNTTNGKTEWEILELYNGVLRDLGSKKSVLVIDLARELPKNSIYYYDFYHFTIEGAQKVGEIIYKRLSTFIEERYPDYLRLHENN